MSFIGGGTSSASPTPDPPEEEQPQAQAEAAAAVAGDLWQPPAVAAAAEPDSEEEDASNEDDVNFFTDNVACSTVWNKSTSSSSNIFSKPALHCIPSDIQYIVHCMLC